MKLKTLKDLYGFDENDLYGLGDEYNLIDVDHIRLLAKEWLKADKSHYYSREGMMETKLWIKHFFNIEEEQV